MKIFVCEYITGGGLYREALPASLVEEGRLMRDAVLHDLKQIPAIKTFSTYDPRLPEPAQADVAIAVTSDPWQSWKDCMTQSDAVLPIAPESGNALLKLTRMVVDHGKLLLGCNPESVALAASKLATNRALDSAGINVVPTWPVAEFPISSFETCVVKPDDGVGCEGTRIIESAEDYQIWLASQSADAYVAQPYLSGIPASLSMLCSAGKAWLLSCNRQKVSVVSGGFVYEGSVVNGARQYWAEFERLAQAIARALPFASGYMGVDVIVHEKGIAVLEINPRLTTSYAGLHAAMGCNPAGLILDLLYNARFSTDGFQMPVNIKRNMVEISFHG